MDEPSQEYDAEGRDPVIGPTKPHLLGVLGPGLITGASDDDPSGIATYSQVGRPSATDSLGHSCSAIR